MCIKRCVKNIPCWDLHMFY